MVTWSNTAATMPNASHTRPGGERNGHAPHSGVAPAASARNHSPMLAAAITLWTMFSLWLVAPLVGARPAVRTMAAVMLWTELAALLMWSYGVERCDERTCAPLAQAAGIAAR